MIATDFSKTHSTIQETLDEVQSIFLEAKIDQPRLNSEWILWDVLSLKNRAEIYLRRLETVSKENRKKILNLAKQRAQKIPIQHLLKKTEFFSLELEVGPDCFIPRPETELLVEKAIEWVQNQSSNKVKILDIGTGSGNISVGIAKNAPQAKIIALDISSKTLEITQKNIRRHGMEKQIRLIASNLASALQLQKPFDMVVTNPPYIDRMDWENLSEEVRFHDPFWALWGGEDGMETIRKILEKLPSLLKEGGVFLMEFGGARQTQALIEEASRLNHFRNIEIIKDYTGEDRILKMIRRSIHG